MKSDKILKSKQARYNKRATILVNIRLTLSTEQDIIEKLSSVDNKSGYIKRLIREDMARENAQK